MTLPLLRTKFYIPPPQPGLVRRLRLTGLINDGLSRKLTLVSAPAGFGKTTLISEWIPNSPRRVAWLSLEEADNDPARFWSYFLGSLQGLQEGLGREALTFLHEEGQPARLAQFEPFLTILLNEISALTGEYALVLDDYQNIEDQAIHAGMAFLIDHLPPGLHLILTCRADPPLPLPRLRARGQMTELRAVDLRFTPDEIGEFLNQIMGLKLTAGQISALEARTEGWIAGLQLAGISMQRREDTTGFIESFTGSHRFILDYLVDEVLSCQSEEVLSFLLETSILERFTGPLCDAVTGRDDGQHILAQLESANLFIIPLDNERRWYRYHRLFADLLRSRLQEIKADQIGALHRRACEWFEREGLLPEAIDHAIKVGDYDRAARLVEAVAEAQRQRGEIATLTGWVDALPAAVRRSHPALCIATARALADTAQNMAVESLLRDAQAGLEAGLPADAPARASLQGQIVALTAYLEITHHRLAQAIELSAQAMQLIPAGDMRWRSFVALNLAGAFRFTSNWTAAAHTYLEASSLSRVAGDKINALTALSMRGEVLQAQGDLHQSAQQFEQVLQLAKELAIPTAPVTGYALIGLGRAWYEWNDLPASAGYISEGIRCGKKGDVKDILLRGYILLARLRQAQDDLDGALDALEQAELAARQTGLQEVAGWVSALRAQVWLARGDDEAAVAWASSITGDLHDSIFPSIAVVLARVRSLQGQADEALRLLDHALQSAYAVGRKGNAIQILVSRVLVLHRQGDHENALSTLSAALAQAEPEGYVRTFLDEGEPMRSLISDLALKRSPLPGDQQAMLDYVHRLLAAFPLHSVSSARKPAPGSLAPSLPEPLSERELEVLRLMAAGLSNRDIAGKDYVSINTVKTQVKSIYGKLGAHTREDAILAAHELGLL